MDWSKYDSEIARVNQRLQYERTKLYRKGGKLYLQGTFPPKPGSIKDRPHQQYLALKLSAKTGIKQAELIARAVSVDLQMNRFNWANWIVMPATKTTPKTIGDWITEFQADFFSGHAKSVTKQDTMVQIEKYLNRLPMDQPLTADILLATIEQYSQPETATRTKYCQNYKRLAKFAGIDLHVDHLNYAYQSQHKALRNLPSKQQIEECISLFDARWGWVYGMLATYGLRNHEVFRLINPFQDRQSFNFADRPSVFVSDTSKTGYHEAFPVYLEWIERFGLTKYNPPVITVQQIKFGSKQWSQVPNRYIGNRIGVEFKRQGCPFTPYDLRRAYAVTLAINGIPDNVAAQWMGHSEQVHSIYSRHVSQIQHLEVWKRSQIGNSLL